MKSEYDFKAKCRDNLELLERTPKGIYVNPAKMEDDIQRMTRPLTDKENAMIEAFIKRQKEIENNE